jgi:ABC-type Fe3+/spermidine/putrescine transport system ATPase subunit
MPYLDLDDVHKAFGTQVVLAGISVGIEEGETLVLLGPSGSGKTTLLRILAGFESPDRGSLTVGGEAVGGLSPARRNFGMVFQHYALFPHLDVGANVAFGLAARGWDRERGAARAREMLELIELPGFERRAIHEISGGQQQRVALARALASSPRVMLLDEPLSNLDPALRERTRRQLRAVLGRVGITTVWVTHEQQEAFDVGDRIAVLDGGRLQQLGTARELYARPATAFVAGFVGDASWLRGRRLGPGRVDVGGGVVWAASEAPDAEEEDVVDVLLRPQDARLVATAPGVLAGTVRHVQFVGHASHAEVEVSGGGRVTVSCAGDAPAIGDSVGVSPRDGRATPRLFPPRPFPSSRAAGA